MSAGVTEQPKRLAEVALTALTIVVGAVLVLALTEGPSSSSQPVAESPQGANAVVITDFAYEPEPVTVPPGTTITFSNADPAPHTATADDGSFDTDTLDQDAEAMITVEEPGTYTYFCKFHMFMNGTVEVK